MLKVAFHPSLNYAYGYLPRNRMIQVKPFIRLQ